MRVPWVSPELQEGAVLCGWGCCVGEPRRPPDSRGNIRCAWDSVVPGGYVKSGSAPFRAGESWDEVTECCDVGAVDQGGD